MNFNIDGLTVDIIEWANDRNIIQGSDLKAQLNKLAEEFGELASGINKNNPDVIEDSVGDMYVVLTIISEINARLHNDTYEEGTNVEDGVYPCIAFDISRAYNTIRNRKGKMVDGIFIKEE